MKFSDIREEDWARWEPWLDTCLLPLTGLNGTELPWEVTQSLEKLRDIMDLVEIPFKGRMSRIRPFIFVPGKAGTANMWKAYADA